MSAISSCWAQKPFLKAPLIILVIANKSSLIGLQKNWQSLSSLHDYESLLLEGLDNSLYDAMNIGVQYAASYGCTHVAFLNSGVMISESVDIPRLACSLSDSPDSILLCDAFETIPLSGKRSRHRLWRSSLEKWRKHPYSMPACHHSIIYPVHLLRRYPFLSAKNFLASDYLNMLQLLQARSSFESLSTCFSDYVNDGLSSKNFCKSIFQRSVAHYIAYDRLPLAIAIFFYNLLKHAAAKICFLR